MHRLHRLAIMMLLGLSFMLTAAPAAAQSDDEPLGARGRIAQQLWGPRQLLKHREALQLTAPQEAAIRKIVKDAHGRLIDLRFDLDAEVTKLEKLLSQPTIDEAAALAASQRVMALEAEIKQTTLRSFIQLKNLLTPAQQQIMRERSKHKDPRSKDAEKAKPRRKVVRERLREAREERD